MKDIIILGAGGASMDIISILEDINKIEKEWNILGLLDDNIDLINKDIVGYKVLGTIDECVNYPQAYFVSSIAHPKNRKVRKKVYERVAKNNLRFATIIHPSTVIMKGVEIDEGAIVRANCVLGACSKIGKDVFISNGSVLSHEAEVMSHTTLATGVKISSGVIIGESCYIGCSVATTHDIKIDSNITLGVGTVAISNIDSSKSNIWVGVPAKPIDLK